VEREGTEVQPTVIIPTFWTKRRTRGGSSKKRMPFDHPTVAGQTGQLQECLRSLEGVSGLGRIIVVVAAADEATVNTAEDGVRDLLADMPDLDTFVFGTAELGSLHRRLEQMEFADVIDGVGLSSYGGARNAGLAMAAVLGSEAVVFVDDDEVVDSADFLYAALEGLGERHPGGGMVFAKTGLYRDDSGAVARAGADPWTDTFWRQREFFDRAVAAVARPPRMKPTSLAFGGCLVLHRDMYCNVPFDPWTVRGEDMDYVINARMHGADMFLDNEWSVVHRPPAPASKALFFGNDVFRFIYAHRKLEFSKSQVDLRQVTAESLEPYPGRLVDGSIGWRSRVTALLRAIVDKERAVYVDIARRQVPEAQEYARDNCERYFVFQRRWPMLMDRLWTDLPLQSLFTGERRVDRGALTGRFPGIRVD
jgi:GT2 family glycosyltransferase